MLWYKGWLETRIRLLVCLGVACLVLAQLHGVSPSAKALRAGVSMFDLMLVNFFVWLAGAGIVTQPAFQNVKGIHGSTQFTLSLPVSRLRLLAVRAALGWMEMAGVIGLYCGGLWVVSPALRAIATSADMLEYCGTLLACGSAFYFLCVVLATFLEDQWRIFGGLFSFVSLWWLSSRVKLPVFADAFLAMGKGSPLLTHSVPWSTIGFSLLLSVLLFFVALKIVRVREY
jgi:hypothetical protein